MDDPLHQPLKRKSSRQKTHFHYINSKGGHNRLSSSPLFDSISLQKNRPILVKHSPNRKLIKRPSPEELKISSEYGIFEELKIQEERRQKQSFKTLKKQSLQLLRKTSRKSMHRNRDNQNRGLQNANPQQGEEKLKLTTNSLAALHEANTNYQPVLCKRGSNALTMSQQFTEAAACLETSQKNYKQKYQESEKKVSELQRMVEEEKKKSERVRQMYQEQIKQLRGQRDGQTFGHIYCFQQKQEIIPDSIILQRTTQSETETSFELSLESR